jgi:hypothetical protein
MGKFRKKPVVVEAVQWLPYRVGDWSEVPDGMFYDPNQDAWFCSTLEGNLKVSAKDWIVTGVMGEVYPVKPDIFEATYEPITEEDDAEGSGSSTDEELGGDSEGPRSAPVTIE